METMLLSPTLNCASALQMSEYELKYIDSLDNTSKKVHLIPKNVNFYFIRCNAEDPIFPEPTTNQPTTASGNLHLASIFVTIFAVFFSFMTDDIYFDVGDVAISY